MGNDPKSLARSGRFGSIKSIFTELGRVNWPTFGLTLRLSIIVLCLSIVLGIFLGLGVDSFFTWLVALLGGQS